MSLVDPKGQDFSLKDKSAYKKWYKSLPVAPSTSAKKDAPVIMKLAGIHQAGTYETVFNEQAWLEHILYKLFGKFKTLLDFSSLVYPCKTDI